ncbi:MAG: DegT/DnrJ/EryC1/StrS family aminotransferase [Bacteroidota bacterium]
MKIPLVDLRAQYHRLKTGIDDAIQNVIEESSFIRGKYVTAFENEFAKKYGIRHCISVANGTDAIYITLKMLGIGEGDEVITTALSWISTSETITQTGATPVFTDIEPEYFCIDANKIEEKITPRTKAVIPVHLYGQPADIHKIKTLCKKHKLFLVEDCAQAHFAEYENLKVGTFGMAATFSFYPGKNLGAYGDAGAIITNDDVLAEKCRMFANHGSLQKHKHLMEGINSRMDGLQGAVLNIKLPYIDEWNNRRLQHALYYNKLLAGIEQVITPQIRKDCKHIFHIYCLRVIDRNALMESLRNNGIETAIHYPAALPNMPAYSYMNCRPSDFPVASEYQDQIVSLPMFPELTNGQIEHVVREIKNFYLS